ncbi:MAG: hypothetical protein WCS96_09440 [Victivallales bacterium]
MKKRLFTAVFCLFMVSQISGTEVNRGEVRDKTDAGMVKINDNGVVFAAGDYGVRLSKDLCWTIRELTCNGKSLMRDCPGAFNGTVLITWAEEEKKDTWVGTGHGYEVVESVKLFADGKEQVIKDGEVYHGNEFRFIKSSDLRVLKLEATTIINDSGISERHRYTVTKMQPHISELYLFMHSFDVNMTKWLVKTSDDKLLSGDFTGNSKEPFRGNIQWVSLYNPVGKIGVVYVLTPTLDKTLHFFWDRVHDRKLYFRGPFENIRKMKKDDSFEYTVKLVGFESQEDAWKEKAATIALSHGKVQ